MIALEYPRSAIPSELTDLRNGRQWFPVSQKERQPDIVFLLVKNHTTTHRLSKGTKAKSDPPAATRCQFAGDAEDGRIS